MFPPAEMAKNAALLLPPVRAAADRRAVTGILGDPEQGERILGEMCGFLDRPLDGLRVLELGPGHGSMLAAAAVASGASYAAFDIRATLPSAEVERLDIDYRTDPAGALSWPDDTFDVVWSYSVLEHVTHPDAVLADVHRVLRPGGRTVALIDLTTHAHGRRDPRLMFEFLRFSERTWRLMTSNRSIYVNRLRRSQWRDAYERAGLGIVGEEADAWTDRLDEFRQVPWLDDLSDEDATTRHLWLAGEVAGG